MHIFATNYFDEMWFTHIDLHEAIRSDAEPIDPLPGAEVMVSVGGEDLTIRLDAQGVRKLRLACQNWERVNK